jgi:hypothetical protein
MNRFEKERLASRLDEEDDMGDSEKRDAYFSEIANQEAEERWQDEH